MNLLKTLKYNILKPHQKGHGIHSPFVYSMVREVFLPAHHASKFGAPMSIETTVPKEALQLLHTNNVPGKYLNLFLHIYHYYGCKSISYNSYDGSTLKCPQMYILHEESCSPGNLSDMFRNIAKDDILIVISPTPALWKRLKVESNAVITIDLLRIGLVFFDSRLSKQHFYVYY